jgi:peptidoglycan/LPS O-acetylase OafA/YrhL
VNHPSSFLLRNNGLDLLRLLSAYLIVVHHFIAHGLTTNIYGFSSNSLFFKIAASLGYIAVSCFVLMSGYFPSRGNFNLSKLIELILYLCFYSISTYLLLLCVVGFKAG